MNLYHLHLLLLVCSGSWVNAKVYFDLTKSSADTENRRRSAEAGPPIANGLMRAASHARAWVQWLRKQLKALRRWCNSHPPEVKLGDASEPKFPKEFKFSEKTNVDRPTQRRELKVEKSPGNVVSLLRAFIFWLSDRFSYYRTLISRHDLIVCMWDYSVKKFWTWVDTAPDSRLGL